MTDEVFLIYSIVYGVFIFILGTVIGSFLNVVVYRTPRHESLIKGRSHCTTCGSQIKNYDLIPIVSWCFLRGKCRNCGSKISVRYTIVEALTGLLFLAAYIFLGISVELIFALILYPILVCVAFIDIDTMEIPYWCSISIGVLGIASIFLTDNMFWYEHLIGAVIVSVPFALFAFLGAMGGGDVQLMAACGLLLGWNIVPGALIGITLGAIGGLITKFVKKTNVIKFGPYLAAGVAAGFIFGDEIIEWYIGLIR